MEPKGVGQLLRKVAQVEDIDPEQSKEHQRLGPLGSVSPEHPRILNQERADIGSNPRQAIDPRLSPSYRQTPALPPLAAKAKPFPATEGAAAALHRRRRIVKEISHARKGEH